MTVSKEEITRVKGLGFLNHKGTDTFAARVITRNGKLTARESRKILEAAEKFGSGDIAMTVRQAVEVQGIPYENIEPFQEFLAEEGLVTGGTGPKVRPIVSCKGTTCQYGLLDSFGVSEEIHNRFYTGYHSVKLPHKFKIAVGGCPNNCVKPDINDLGIIGQCVPQPDYDKCRGCKVCVIEKVCPMGAAMKREDGKMRIDTAVCINCGRCDGKCPFHTTDNGLRGYKVTIGGRWGKKMARGRAIEKVIQDKDEMLDIVEKAILLFREQGEPKERFADTISRIGFENVQEQLLDNGLLERKEQILAD